MTESKKVFKEMNIPFQNIDMQIHQGKSSSYTLNNDVSVDMIYKY